MSATPKLEQRPAQHFVARRLQVPIPFSQYLQPAWEEVGTWLEKQGASPSGPPIIRYLAIDMATFLTIEVGFPVEKALEADERISVDIFPAGCYAVSTYTGTYKGKGLMKATAALLDWAQEHKITWDTSTIDNVEWWRARYESYITDPEEEPDPKKWQTEIIFLTTGES